MAQATATQKKKTGNTTRQKIIKAYQRHVLRHGENPSSVFAFCEDIKIEEGTFYKYFSGFEQIQGTFWRSLFEENLERLENTPEWEEFAVREKLLSFYFSFFESLKQNRSYALYSLKGGGQQLNPDRKELEELKKPYKRWIKALMAEGRNKEEIASRSRLSDQYDTLFWYQLLFLLDFWRKDGSTAFERTDEAIEKAVNLAFDLIEKNAIDSAFDFGKFLFQNFR